jgi:hypothetical protein
MINTKVGFKITLLLLLMTSFLFAAKEIYLPNFFKQQGIDFESPNAQWSRSRMDSTANWIILWESGFGSDPSSNAAPYKVNMSQLKEVLEKSYEMNLNTMKMVVKGSSKTDQYKMIVFIKYSTTWGAYGSGYDNVIGSLEVNPAAANIPSVVAHEIGHTFQYQAGCDVPEGGFRYGLGANGEGGNGFWEQAAQWASFQVYPEEQFLTYDFNNYISSNHLHILHEEPRYANYFLPDYWAYKRGIDFMGRLWRESRRPEDPVDAYKRLFNVSQSEFNEEIFEHAVRLTTWDLPAIKQRGANYIQRRAQVKMKKTTDQYWLVDSAVTIENYGYNSIKLNAPSTETQVSVHFQGKAGASGYRSINIDKAGWYFGFVALLNNGERVYSDVGSLEYSGGKNPEGALSFNVPAGCSYLWLVVSGAPQEHWHHVWDDSTYNDEQWPYQVKFSNTNLLGEQNESTTNYSLSTAVDGSGSISPSSGSYPSGSLTLKATPTPGYVFDHWSGDLTGSENPAVLKLDQDKSVTAHFIKLKTTVEEFTFQLTMSPKSDYSPTAVPLDKSAIALAFGLSESDLVEKIGTDIRYYAVNPDESFDANSTAIDPGHWYNAEGQVVSYGDQAVIYSEINKNTLTANIGQYPDRSVKGDSYLIKQALVYQKSATEEVQVHLIYSIKIDESLKIRTRALPPILSQGERPILSSEILSLMSAGRGELQVYNLKGKLMASVKQVSSWSDLGMNQNGVYKIVFLENNKIKAIQSISYVR